MTDENEKKIEELLTRGVEEIIDKENLIKKLKSGKRLRVKLGIDPTSPNIHIGRAIPLLKLRDFQNLGHKIIFIIGDFTGVIGDTSDKESERPMLEKKQVEENMKTYITQAKKILDIKKCEIHYNSKWLGKLNYHEIGRQADIFSLNEFSSRENIKKRMDAGKRVSLRELFYPLMQGYDSVAVKADVELGGTDQKFNLLSGREIQRYYNQEPQDIITNPLIEGLDGRKMSSSWGNTINLLDNANEMYGKIMSLKDEFIIRYFILTTRVEMEEIKNIENGLNNKLINPRDAKAKLAKEIVKMYHGEKEAEKAEKEFDKIFRDKEIPTEIEEVLVSETKLSILDLLVKTKIALSKAEARRLVEQKAVKIDGKVCDNWQEEVEIKKGMIIQAGKRKFVKIV